VSEGQRKWIDEAKRELKCEDEDDLTADIFARPNKSVMSRWLEGARDIMCRQQQMLENFKDLVSTMKTLTSSTAVQQILTRASLLKQQERLKDVYVSPDRSPEERSARRLLVEERKKKAAEEPERTHFIKGGKVCSVDKT